MSYKSFFSVHIRDVCPVNSKIVGASLFIKHRNTVVFCQILVQQGGQKCTKAESVRMCTGEGNVGAIICRKASKNNEERRINVFCPLLRAARSYILKINR